MGRQHAAATDQRDESHVTGELDKMTLVAAVDTVIPVDESPGGWDGGTADLLAHEPDLAAPCWRPLARSLPHSMTRPVSSPWWASQLDYERRQQVFDVVAKNADLAVPVAMLVNLAMQGYYAAARHGEPAGLAMIGFRGVPHGVQTVEPEPWPTVQHDQLDPYYDVVIVEPEPAAASMRECSPRAAQGYCCSSGPPHTRTQNYEETTSAETGGLTQVTASPAQAIPESSCKPTDRPRNAEPRPDDVGPQRDGGRWRHPGLAGHGVAIHARRLRHGEHLRHTRGQHADRLALRL